MRFSQRMKITVGAFTAVALCAGLAMAHGTSASRVTVVVPAAHTFSGTWPVTVTNSQFNNTTGCLTLTGNAKGGQASLVFKNVKYNFGSFLVSDGILVATIQEPLGSQNGALMFVAHTIHGGIGQGIFEAVAGGSDFDAGNLAFGTRNGC